MEMVHASKKQDIWLGGYDLELVTIKKLDELYGDSTAISNKFSTSNKSGYFIGFIPTFSRARDMARLTMKCLEGLDSDGSLPTSAERFFEQRDSWLQSCAMPELMLYRYFMSDTECKSTFSLDEQKMYAFIGLFIHSPKYLSEPRNRDIILSHEPLLRQRDIGLIIEEEALESLKARESTWQSLLYATGGTTVVVQT